MARNPIGKNTKTVDINMRQTMADELEKRAKSMHISTSVYCNIILKQWMESGKELNLKEGNILTLRTRYMRQIPEAPKRFSGSLDELYKSHAQHVLIEAARVKVLHRALVEYLVTDDPVYLVRKVKGLERGKTTRTRRGHLIKATDNSPAWYIHYELFTSSFSSGSIFPAFMDSVPCHMFRIKLPQNINAAGWHVAHLFDAKDGNTDYENWDRNELSRRMVRNIHPCNYFYLPKIDWQKYGGTSEILSYFHDKFSAMYSEVWEEFLALADAEPITHSPRCELFEYSISAATKNISSEQKMRRMTFKKEWVELDVFVTFTYEGTTYRYPHDELLKTLINQIGIIEGTASWERDGNYNFRKLSKMQKLILEPYIIG